jgi:hypothetical protein
MVSLATIKYWYVNACSIPPHPHAQMAELQFIDGAPGVFVAPVMVTEDMLTDVARAGDLEQLQEWGRHGVCVKSFRPLMSAIRGHEEAYGRGDVDVLQGRLLDVLRCLVRKLSADVNKAMPNGDTPLCRAATSGVAVVQCLAMELGADVNQAGRYDYTPLISTTLMEKGSSAEKVAQVRCLIQLGASMDVVENENGNTAFLISARFA